MCVCVCVCVEAKLGIFKYNSKQLYYKTKLFLIKDLGLSFFAIALLKGFTRTFNSFACLLIDVLRSFLMAVEKAVKKPSFRILFNPSLPLFPQDALFLSNILLCFGWTKNLWLGVGIKQIIDSLSFLFLLTYIELSFNFKKCLNNRDNYEYLDL